MPAAKSPTRRSKTADIGEAITLLRLIMLVCFRSRATDIHIEPRIGGCARPHPRGRNDGRCRPPEQGTGRQAASAVKVLSDIDISQRKYHPGRPLQRPHAQQAQARKAEMIKNAASIIASASPPSMHGQKLVVRVLDTSNAPLHIEDLKLPAKARRDHPPDQRAGSRHDPRLRPDGFGQDDHALRHPPRHRHQPAQRRHH